MIIIQRINYYFLGMTLKWISFFKRSSLSEKDEPYVDSLKANVLKGQNVALITSLSTLILVMLKYTAGVLFNSDLLVADAFHCGADLLAISASFLGLKFAATKKSDIFPYGFYKAETFALFLISLFIMWAAYELFHEGAVKILSHERSITFHYIPITVSGFSAVASFFIACLQKKVGEEIQSPSLIANANESFLDVAASAVVCIGIALNAFNIPYVEGIIILLIATMIAKLGIENIRASVLALLDANLHPELTKKMIEDISKVDGVISVPNLKMRSTGMANFVELSFIAKPNISLSKAHTIADDVEKYIVTNYSNIESVVCHMEPENKETCIIAVPVSDTSGINTKISSSFVRTPYIAVLKMRATEFDMIAFYKNPFIKDQQYAGLNLSFFLSKLKVDVLIIQRVEPFVFDCIQQYPVTVFQSRGSILNNEIRRLAGNHLREIKASNCS